MKKKVSYMEVWKAAAWIGAAIVLWVFLIGILVAMSYG